MASGRTTDGQPAGSPPSLDEPTACGHARHPHYGRWLRGILTLAVALRVAIVIYAEWRPARFDYPDSHRYVLVAQNIAAGRGPVESDAIRAGTDPLYPVLLSAGALLGFDGVDAVMRFGRVVNILFGVASVALLAALARRLVGDRAALAAAAILAVDPILLFFNALVLTETCYTAMLLAAFCGMTCSGESRGWLWAAGAGLALGLATLTRSSSLFLPIVLVPFLWHFSGGAEEGFSVHACVPAECRGRRRILVAACFLLATTAALVPTVARNHRLFGRFVPVRTGGGASLMEALGPWADGGPGMDRIAFPALPPETDEAARDAAYRAAALDWARRHPGETLRLAWRKLRRTWSVTINAPSYTSPRYAVIAWLTVAPEFVLAGWGLWILRHRRWTAALLLIVAIYFTSVHMVFVGSVRYRVPAMPLLFVLAGVAAERLGRGMTRRFAA